MSSKKHKHCLPVAAPLPPSRQFFRFPHLSVYNRYSCYRTRIYECEFTFNDIESILDILGNYVVMDPYYILNKV